MRKTPGTGYGIVGTELIRLTVAILDSGKAVIVRADGHNAIIGTLPTVYRTSGDVVSVLASMHADYGLYGTASVPATLPAHGWKPSYNLDDFAAHMGVDPKVVESLKATYAEVQG